MKPLAPLATVERGDRLQAWNHAVSVGGQTAIVADPQRTTAFEDLQHLATVINSQHAAVLEPLLAQLSALKAAVGDALITNSPGHLLKLLAALDSLPPYVPAARLEEAQRVLADALEATGVDKLRAELAELKRRIADAIGVILTLPGEWKVANALAVLRGNEAAKAWTNLERHPDELRASANTPHPSAARFPFDGAPLFEPDPNSDPSRRR